MPDSQDFCTIEVALAELRAGRMIVLVDDEQRENEGDIVIPAECATLPLRPKHGEGAGRFYFRCFFRKSSTGACVVSVPRFSLSK